MKFTAILSGISIGILWILVGKDAVGWIIGLIWGGLMPPLLLANPEKSPPRIFVPILGAIMLPLLIWATAKDGINLLFFGQIASVVLFLASQWMFITERDRAPTNAE